MKKYGMSLVFFLIVVVLSLRWDLVVSEAAPKVSAEFDTLENQTMFAGSAQTDTTISCSVYTYDENNRTTLLYQYSEVVGKSQLYQLTVPLPVLGRQYVTIRIGDEETTYAYNRYRKELAADLQEYYLNVYEVLTGGSQ